MQSKTSNNCELTDGQMNGVVSISYELIEDEANDLLKEVQCLPD